MAKVKIKKLKLIIESFRRKYHYFVDMDCWYSCPLHKDYCGDDEELECTCGADKHNAKVDEALQLLQDIEGEKINGES